MAAQFDAYVDQLIGEMREGRLVAAPRAGPALVGRRESGPGPVHHLFLSSRPQEVKERILRDFVGLARGISKDRTRTSSARGRARKVLAGVRSELVQLGVVSTQLMEELVGPVARQAVRVSPLSPTRSRDIRLDSDPSLPCRRDVLVPSPVREEEELLLDSDSEFPVLGEASVEEMEVVAPEPPSSLPDEAKPSAETVEPVVSSAGASAGSLEGQGKERTKRRRLSRRRVKKAMATQANADVTVGRAEKRLASPDARQVKTVRTEGGRSVVSLSVTARGEPAGREGEVSERCPFQGCGERWGSCHVFAAGHLPLLFQEGLPDPDVALARVVGLRTLAALLLGTSASLSELVESAVGLVTGVRVSGALRGDMEALCCALDRDLPEPLQWGGEGGDPVFLLHWRVLSFIASMLPPTKHARFLAVRCPGVVPLRFRGLDSHCHLDRLGIKVGLSVAKNCLAEFLSCRLPMGGPFVKVDGVVANFCDPHTYPTAEQVKRLVTEGAAVAVGIHPKKVKQLSDEKFAELKGLLDMPEVTALGEVGIDQTVDSLEMVHQWALLDRILPLAQPRHVLVFHARGPEGDSGAGAYEVLFRQLVFLNVPSEQRIHLHCFCGPFEIAERWLARFPNTHFGFVHTGLGNPRSVLPRLPRDRILLETDSPYFLERGGTTRASSPSFVGLAAQMVADVLGESWAEVLRFTAETARGLYFRA